MADSGGEKKHAPTVRRRQRAREQGQVARSQDLTSAVLLLAALAALWLLGGRAAEHLAAAIAEGLSTNSIGSFASEDATQIFMRSGGRMAIAVAPILIAMMFIGILINVSQTGFLLVPSKLFPSLTNISPQTGVQRILSLPGFARFGFGIVKVSVVIAVAYAAISHYGDRVMNLAGLEVHQVARSLFECLVGTCLWIGGALFALALVDFGFQRWKHERDLMMTDEELREEMRETEVDPAIADRRRQTRQGQNKQGQIQQGRGGQSSPAGVISADVVITGKSGVAIAIQYNPMTMHAPIVVAKGRGKSAQTIQSMAARNGIAIAERSLLAEHQFRSTDVGAEISADQYQAVAEVLRKKVA